MRSMHTFEEMGHFDLRLHLLREHGFALHEINSIPDLRTIQHKMEHDKAEQ